MIIIVRMLRQHLFLHALCSVVAEAPLICCFKDIRKIIVMLKRQEYILGKNGCWTIIYVNETKFPFLGGMDSLGPIGAAHPVLAQ